MDKYTSIPHEILERIIAQRLSASQMTALLYVIRKTYGWHKGDFGDAISISDIAKKSGYSRRAMINAVHDLEKMGILELDGGGIGRLSNMRIRDVSEWDNL